MMLVPPLIYVFVALCSLLIGSFLNVLIYRLPQILKRQWEEGLSDFTGLASQNFSEINLCFPRSFCPHCKSTIKASKNIPILSYFMLRRRCKNCQNPISLRYPLVELLSCLLALCSASYFGITLQFGFSLIFIWLSLALFFIDLEHYLLPDSLTLLLLWIGLIANTQNMFTPLTTAVVSAALAYCTLWGFNKLFYLTTNKIGMGNGDFKLFAAFGAWFGYLKLLLILLLASMIGVTFGILYLKLQKKDRNTPIPFGPFICFSGIIFLFFGNQIINYYLI